MFKSAVTVCLWAMVFLGSGVQVWSEDIENRFIDPDLDTSKSIFIDVKDASLVNVLKIFSQQSGLSFIASPDVADKKVTLYLNKIPLNQALHMVLDANDLTYVMQEDTDVFVVKAKAMAAKNLITKVYQLKYATVSTSKLSASGSAGGASRGGGSLEDALKNAISPDGKVIEDGRTNSLIITDVPAQFENIESTIARLDVPVPQILVEVEMLDISKSVADKLGITYGATPITFTGGIKMVNYPFSTSSVAGETSTLATSSGTGNAAGDFPGLWNANGMTAALNFLTQTTDARTLARPRILTLNNQTAEIQISTDQAIDVLPSSSSSGTAGSVQTFTVDRYTTGVILNVTPQANLLTREITMHVNPRVIDLILSQVQPPAGIGGSIFDPQTRGSDSLLKLKDGQSMVIGGLMNNQTNNNVTKLPFLGDLPLIGSAFRSTNKTTTQRELIIFLTPHIIDDLGHSGLKGDSSSISPEAALDLQDASDRIQEVTNSLNSYDNNR